MMRKKIKSLAKNTPLGSALTSTNKMIKLLRGDRFEFGKSNKNGKILLACFPKSGSSFTTSVISQIGNYERMGLVYAYGMREQELDSRKCHQLRSTSFIAQHHVRYSEYTAKLILQYNLTPVVLVRNIYDCIVSMADHIRSENYKWPMCTLFEEHCNLSDQDLFLMITDYFIPWYINFYIGWITSPVNPLLVTYEDMVSDQVTFFEKILRADGYQTEELEIDDAIAICLSGKHKIRFNHGVINRGKILPPEVREKVHQLVSYYPSIDFSPVGIKS
jgi:hypothetical protein